MKSTCERPPYFDLVRAGEPFRLLFPLGTLLGLCGVLLWPLYALGWIEAYPAAAHNRIMIQGFMSAFVVGFLGTALPRLLEVPRFSLVHAGVFSAAFALLTGLHLSGLSLAGDAAYFVVFGAFLFLLVGRFRRRRDNPPPGFVLVALGMASAMAGTLLLFLEGVADPGSPFLAQLGRLLAWQGFLLLPIMGIGAFLLPRFFGLPNRQGFPETLEFSREWIAMAIFAAICGGLVMTGFLLEAAGWVMVGHWLRALGVVLYFYREVPFHRAGFGGGSMALGLRVALLFIPVGLALGGIFPAYANTLNHIVFITGFGMLTFVVATRVLLGHGGGEGLFRATHPAILLMVGLTLLALLLRILADTTSWDRFVVYGIAGGIWILAISIWAFRFLPFIREPEEE